MSTPPATTRLLAAFAAGLALPLLIAPTLRPNDPPAPAALPAIFSVGGKIISPAGEEISVKEVNGGWIRAEGYFTSDAITWIYVPTGVSWRVKK
jgi:hypothetical protein